MKKAFCKTPMQNNNEKPSAKNVLLKSHSKTTNKKPLCKTLLQNPYAKQ